VEKKYIFVSSIIISLLAYYYYRSDTSTFTLYRNSLVLHGESWRLHIATFDARSGFFIGDKDAYYNKENCYLAASLFQNQPDVKTKFWCEKGRYRE